MSKTTWALRGPSRASGPWSRLSGPERLALPAQRPVASARAVLRPFPTTLSSSPLKDRSRPLAAGAARLGLPGLALLVLASFSLARVPQSSEVVGELATYAELDASLTGCELLPRAASWSWFPGTENPSEDEAWTKSSFDVSGWATGPGPFGYGHDDLGTTIDKAAKSLYLRRTFELVDKTRYRRILLELPIDDGYIFYANGNAEDRLHAGKPEPPATFEKEASIERPLDMPPVPVVDLTPMLREGSNVLALQVLVHASDRESMGAYPRIHALYDRSVRTEVLADRAERVAAQPRLAAYLAARTHQLEGRFEEAIEGFRALLERDPASPEPWARLLECHRAADRVAELEPWFEARIAAAGATPAMLDVFAEVALLENDRSFEDFLASLPSGLSELPAEGFFADALWAARTLTAGRPLFIDCGATQDHEADGRTWSRDRFHTTGVGIALPPVGPRAVGVGDTIRMGIRAATELPPLYRVPLPSGDYEVRLHFNGRNGPEAELSSGQCVIDVLLEGARVLRDYDPVDAAGRFAIDVVHFPIHVQDDFLELDLWPKAAQVPWLAGLEVHPVSPERFRTLAEEFVRATDRGEAAALFALGRAHLAAGELEAAHAVLEEAERLPSFQPDQADVLAEVRAALLPKLMSFAAVDDLVARRGAAAESLLADEGSGPLTTYLAGRIHQEAGRIDAAIMSFEELVADGSEASEAWLRMAQCLADAGLRPEAEGLIGEAFGLGVAPTTELLNLYISLALESERDPWELVAELRELGAPDELVCVPNSDEAPRTWKFTAIEPTANVWSRPAYEDFDWETGPGSFGAGQVIGGNARTLWSGDTLYGRMTFRTSAPRMLFPHFTVAANDATDVYVNGARYARVSIPTDGYVRMPLRSLPFVEGWNTLGMHGINVRQAGIVDLGLVQPLGELYRIADALGTDGALRLNCGGGEYVGADGTVWGADRLYAWCPAYDRTSEGGVAVSGTDDDDLFRACRLFYNDTDEASYEIPLPNGRYLVRLHFAEIEDASQAVGARVFDIVLEGETVLPRFDVFAQAGASNVLTKEFAIDVTDGWFDLLLTDVDDFGFVSALEIVAESGR